MNYFIIDQINPHTGEFDEHKIIIGANIKNAVEAALIYLSNYEPDWQGLGAISEATPHIFDLWLKHGSRKEPFSNSDFAEKPLHLALVGDAAPDPSKSRHWITTETGSHILINGNGEVLAGAGGKLAGKKFSIPTGSKDVSKHIETVEKIAQAGYEKHGGDKAEYLRMGRNKGSSSYFAREYLKSGNVPEGHLKEALTENNDDKIIEENAKKLLETVRKYGKDSIQTENAFQDALYNVVKNSKSGYAQKNFKDFILFELDKDEYGEKQKPTDDDNETNFANIGQDIELKENTHKPADNDAANGGQNSKPTLNPALSGLKALAEEYGEKQKPADNIKNKKSIEEALSEIKGTAGGIFSTDAIKNLEKRALEGDKFAEKEAINQRSSLLYNLQRREWITKGGEGELSDFMQNKSELSHIDYREPFFYKEPTNHALSGLKALAEEYGANNNLQANNKPATLSSPSQNETNNNNEGSKMEKYSDFESKANGILKNINPTELGQDRAKRDDAQVLAQKAGVSLSNKVFETDFTQSDKDKISGYLMGEEIAKNTTPPKLEGSQKQVDWAEKIRAKHLKTAAVLSKINTDKIPASNQAMRDAANQLKTQAESILNNKSAKFWIDNQNSINSLLNPDNNAFKSKILHALSENLIYKLMF